MALVIHGGNRIKWKIFYEKRISNFSILIKWLKKTKKNKILWQEIYEVLNTNKELLKVKKFIIESFNNGYRKLLIVTGKGLRSKYHNNPYLSEKLSVLKYSVPEYIKNDENLNHKISKISKADVKDGGDGAIYIFLKNNKKFIE